MFYKRPPFFLQLILGFITLSILPKLSAAQKKQLTPSDKVVKIAYIDHSRIRREYKAFSELIITMSNANAERKKLYAESLQVLKKQVAKKIKSDSLDGEKNKEKIISQFAEKEQVITNTYQVYVAEKFQERAKLLQEYEVKIAVAIGAIVSEDGFTDVKPIETKTIQLSGADITDLILKKLN